MGFRMRIRSNIRQHLRGQYDDHDPAQSERSNKKKNSAACVITKFNMNHPYTCTSTQEEEHHRKGAEGERCRFEWLFGRLQSDNIARVDRKFGHSQQYSHTNTQTHSHIDTIGREEENLQQRN